MSKRFMFEKPLGMRDTFPIIYETKQSMKKRINKTMEMWGYRFLETPTLEFYETVGAASSTMDQQLFKLLDQQGHTLVLRPDMTAPIARVASSKLLNDQIPLRLAYSANVFRAQQNEGGRPAEFEQAGIELIGDPTISADAEVIALMVSVLRDAGLENFQISIGHIGFVQDLFIQILGNKERANELSGFLFDKNFVGYRQHVSSLGLSSIDKERLMKFLQIRGTHEVIEQAYDLIENNQGKQALIQLEELWNQLEEYGISEYVKLDLSLVSHLSYYTGILFEVYAEKVGSPIGNGGRYDKLLGKFGKDTVATGFGLRLDYLIEAIEVLEKPSSTHCILFSAERRKEAFQQARDMRLQGKYVLAQDIAGVQDVDRFTKSFSDVTYLIGAAPDREGIRS
ncbi:ATP phosphoribosyltransferase regulatory subunit [Falsibacillus albus]|uniref:ATP phosphoribosyltransferase regulatory subunit n=1 Tax=Falsibacillus albus TaxID=2478915 RepID=A0A3L7K0T8_9BACI|nr:ATP phosphoribosyltransferase regulatory subunit [Falsibacillus albus]RLQ96697.1 ATP phosphoribosyltransferase regulatory subunit [Falsibacillus albus]